MTRPRDIADGINRIDTSAADATAITIDANENVGIGTSSPAVRLDITPSGAGAFGELFRVKGTNTGFGQNASMRVIGGNSDSTGLLIQQLGSGSSSGAIASIYNEQNSHLLFGTNNTERMRIDSSGNLLVGTTTDFASGTVDGIIAQGTNKPAAAFSNTQNGQLVKFYQGSNLVGSIGVASGGRLYIGEDDVGLRFAGDLNQIAPWNPSTNSVSNNIIDLGEFSVARFNDAYITNGVTTGSDQNEKQQIATLTTAEIAAAKRISNGFKTFKWNDAVEAKGDNARTHTGVIAQEVRTALEAEGLDAGDYAFFMSKTWWETQTEVPAVEADEENGIEAQDAYTRTDTYDTAEEAPEGAVERTRLGIRYPELLAFVGAATEQRLTHLETLEARIVALENA